jgi:hypothetical protein
MDAMDSSLEVFIVNCSRLMPYHDHVLQSLNGAKEAGQEQWEEVFAFTVSNRSVPIPPHLTAIHSTEQTFPHEDYWVLPVDLRKLLGIHDLSKAC